jgi:hypothetical protein
MVQKIAAPENREFIYCRIDDLKFTSSGNRKNAGYTGSIPSQPQVLYSMEHF